MEIGRIHPQAKFHPSVGWYVPDPAAHRAALIERAVRNVISPEARYPGLDSSVRILVGHDTVAAIRSEFRRLENEQGSSRQN